MTDTVGFIRKLPHQLVEAFKATLEETVNADLILHVVDASVPEEELDEMMRGGRRGARGDRRGRQAAAARAEQDRPARRRRAPAAGRRATATPCWSRRSTGEGLDELRRAHRAGVPRRRCEAVELLVPYERGAVLSELHELAGDLEREDTRRGRAREGTRAGRRRGAPARRTTLNGRTTASLIVELPAPRPQAARAPSRAHEHDAGYDLRAAEAATHRTGRAGERRHRASRSRSRRATPGSCCRAPASRRATASRS